MGGTLHPVGDSPEEGTPGEGLGGSSHPAEEDIQTCFGCGCDGEIHGDLAVDFAKGINR